MGHTDGFGRSKLRRGPKGEGFSLDSDGNYIVSNKRIRQVQDPESDEDAVNKQWSERNWKEAMKLARHCLERIHQLQQSYNRLVKIVASKQHLNRESGRRRRRRRR